MIKQESVKLKSEENLDQLFSAMIKSSKYVDYNSQHQDFISKMKFLGDTTLINTEAKMLTWIGNNITSTNFNSYSAALSQWSYITEMYDSVYPPIFPPIASVTSCAQGCRNSFNSAVDGYADSYAAAVEQAVRITSATSSKMIIAARTVFLISSGIAADNYATCLAGC